MGVLDEKREELLALCRRHRVKSLDVFGSVDTDRFGESSDLDFLVEFLEEEPVARSEAFFGLLADLEDLFDRRIDLVVDSAVTNPFFREELEETRRSLFAA